MSIRANVAVGAWVQVGTGPALVQLISPDANGAEIMVLCAASTPTGNTTDGVVLSSEFPFFKFSLAQPIWANAIVAGQLAVQPDVAG